MSIDLSLFEQKPFPSHWPLVPPGLEGDGWERDEVIRFFSGKRLSDVTYEALRSDYRKDWTAAHYLMSEQALAFFLPALLRVGQDHYEDTSNNAPLLADQLVFFLLRMARGELDHHLLPLLRSYSREQLGAIALFLQEMSDQHYRKLASLDEAAQALKIFWHQYLD